MPCQHKSVQRTLGGNVPGTFLLKVFLMFSGRLFASFPHKNQGIFTHHLTSDNPFLPITPIHADHV